MGPVLYRALVVYLFMFGASKCACVSVTVGVNVLHSGWYLDVKMDFRIHIMLHYKFNPASVTKVSTPVFITKKLSYHLTRNTILFQIFINLKLQR